jgi:hypothetical protein
LRQIFSVLFSLYVASIELASSAGHCADAEDAPADVDAAVVLAADVSRSIDDGEFALERRGARELLQPIVDDFPEHRSGRDLQEATELLSGLR